MCVSPDEQELQYISSTSLQLCGAERKVFLQQKAGISFVHRQDEGIMCFRWSLVGLGRSGIGFKNGRRCCLLMEER